MADPDNGINITETFLSITANIEAIRQTLYMQKLVEPSALAEAFRLCLAELRRDPYRLEKSLEFR